MNTKDKYHVIGLMSGTSLDGVDIAYSIFTINNGKWSFEIKQAETIAYDETWRKRFEALPDKSAYEFVTTDREYGKYLGELVKTFVAKHHLQVDFVSSHGHTIFHQPEKGITVQAGNGAALAAAAGLTAVCDFRSLDVALGGQGAPLVPIGDKLLFAEYDYCLNLGGIANISFDKDGDRIAFDICPANMALNVLALEAGKEYDEDGNLARKGHVNASLLNELNALDYYSISYPKSLGREGVEKGFLPVLKKHAVSIEDKLCTVCEHIAIQTAKAIGTKKQNEKMLITGGGALNKFLVERISAHVPEKVILPSATIINFKEALIFAFLGVLRLRNEINCLKKVTGAKHDSSGGVIYQL